MIILKRSYQSDHVFKPLVISSIIKKKKRPEKKKENKRKQRNVWVKPWLNRRNELGIYNTLLTELRMEDEGEY